MTIGMLKVTMIRTLLTHRNREWLPNRLFACVGETKIKLKKKRSRLIKNKAGYQLFFRCCIREKFAPLHAYQCGCTEEISWLIVAAELPPSVSLFKLGERFIEEEIIINE